MSDTGTVEEKSLSASRRKADDVAAERSAHYRGNLATAPGDIEDQLSLDASKSEKTGESEPVDPYLVNWNGPNDPENPLNFSGKQKWALMASIASIAFLTYASPNAALPWVTTEIVQF